MYDKNRQRRNRICQEIGRIIGFAILSNENLRNLKATAVAFLSDLLIRPGRLVRDELPLRVFKGINTLYLTVGWGQGSKSFDLGEILQPCALERLESLAVKGAWATTEWKGCTYSVSPKYSEEELKQIAWGDFAEAHDRMQDYREFWCEKRAERDYDKATLINVVGDLLIEPQVVMNEIATHYNFENKNFCRVQDMDYLLDRLC